MKYIIIDLEWNGNISGRTRQYFNELIEIGAVRLDEKLNQTDTFQALIKPVHHKRLTGRVRGLTHLTNTDIRGGISFAEVFNGFCDWVGEGDNCFMSWGTGDLLVLLENLDYYKMRGKLAVMKSFCDAQAVCMDALGCGNAHQPSVSAVAEAAGVSLGEMGLHRALDDSIITARCLKALMTPEMLERRRAHADENFFRRLAFKPRYICNPQSGHIKASALNHDCPNCGGRLARTGDFFIRSKSICAEYTCAACHKEYIIKDRFRLMFEGVEHRVSISEKKNDKE